MPKALVIGDVIDDILVRPLAPIRPDTDTSSEISNEPGGSGANFACWLAKAQGFAKAGELTGLDVTFVGRVAAADLERHSAVLRGYGVRPLLQADEVAATGAIVVIAEPNSRSFLTSRGANQNLDLGAVTSEELVGFDLVYVSGYSVFGEGQAAQFAELVRRAHAAGCRVAVDPGSASFIAEFGVPRFLDLLAGVDVLLPNLEEGRVLSGEHRADVIAAHLAERFEEVVLTLGADGVQLAQRGQPTQHVPAFAADALDSTGAGDAFAAGYLAARLAGRSPEASAVIGARMGAIAVTLVGGRP